MFLVVYPRLGVLNVMRLDNPHTAILAAVIYNALIIPALIPLALRGVRFRPLDGAAILRRNGLIYGLGGVIAPFAFFKLPELGLPPPRRFGSTPSPPRARGRAEPSPPGT